MKWRLMIHLKGAGMKYIYTGEPMDDNEKLKIQDWHRRTDGLSPMLQLSGNKSTVQVHVEDVAYLEWEEVKDGN